MPNPDIDRGISDMIMIVAFIIKTLKKLILCENDLNKKKIIRDAVIHFKKVNKKFINIIFFLFFK